MNEPKCLFKVGETYPDKDGDQVEIIFIRIDECEFPIVGIARFSNGESLISTYTLSGQKYEYKSNQDLIPPQLPKKRVPLGPEDVPPGSVISQNPAESWKAVVNLFRGGVDTTSFYSWKSLMKMGFQIKRPGSDWQPMWKEIDDESNESELPQ